MGGPQRTRQNTARKTMGVDLDDFKNLVDRVDTKFGHDVLVAELVGTLDHMIETMENHGRVYRRRKHQYAGVSGYRNVTFHKKTGKWTGRIRYTNAQGNVVRKQTGYFADPKDASDAIEEIRARLQLT